MSSNAPPTEPGATCSLLPVSAAVEFLTVSVKYPVEETVAVTFGTAELIAEANPASVLFGLTGTATSISLTRKVSPAVSAGFAMVDVIVPYTRLWFTLRCTAPAFQPLTLSCGAPTYKLQL